MEDLRYISCQVLHQSKTDCQPIVQNAKIASRIIAGEDLSDSESDPSDIDQDPVQIGDVLDLDEECGISSKDCWKPEEFVDKDPIFFDFPSTLPSEVSMEYLGVVYAILDNQVIVQSTVIHAPLDRGSLLCVYEGRQVIGKISEIFGPVSNPFYIVPISPPSSSAHSLLAGDSFLGGVCGIEIGTKIFYSPNLSSLIATSELKKEKGCDASNQLDQEIDDNEMEYSDDEQERMKKQVRKRKLSKSSLPDDDDDDDYENVCGEEDGEVVDRGKDANLKSYFSLKDRAYEDSQNNISLQY